MNFLYVIEGMIYLLGFEALYDPDIKYIGVIENQGTIVLTPAGEKDDDAETRYFNDISDPDFKDYLLETFDRCDYEVLAFVELYGCYYSKLTQTINILDAIKMCCDFRETDEVPVRVI